MPNPLEQYRGRLWVSLVIGFVLLQAIDATLTTVGVRMYGMELEANPIAAATFAKFGVLQGALLVKVLSFLVFFGLLWYCVYVRWTVLDIVGLLWKRTPKRDIGYSMTCFNVVAIVTTLASLYAGCGWVYLLVTLGMSSSR